MSWRTGDLRGWRGLEQQPPWQSQLGAGVQLRPAAAWNGGSNLASTVFTDQTPSEETMESVRKREQLGLWPLHRDIPRPSINAVR